MTYKTIEFVHIKTLFRKVPINTYYLDNYYAKEVVTFESYRIRNSQKNWTPSWKTTKALATCFASTGQQWNWTLMALTNALFRCRATKQSLLFQKSLVSKVSSGRLSS